MRVRTVATVVSGLALIGGLSACDLGAKSGGAAPAAPTSVSAPAPSSSSTEAPAPSKSKTAKPVGNDTENDKATTFKAELTIQKEGLGLLAVTNTGKSAATVQGWPALTFRDAANETVRVPVTKVEVPGEGPSITLQPGRTAFAGVRWMTGDKADPSTAVATTVQVTPPGADRATTVSVVGTDGQTKGYAEFDITSVEVGTLQPVTQGVLAF